jgi:hypothetical protein
MAGNLTWFEARALARQGKAIRRESWTKWLVRGPALWYISTVDEDDVETRTVVLPGDFKVADFMANDWTDAALAGGGTPPEGTPWTGREGGAGNFGSLTNLPHVTSLFQPNAAGAGSYETPRPEYAHNPPAGNPYGLSIEIVEPITLSVDGFYSTTIYARMAVTGGPALSTLGIVSVYLLTDGGTAGFYTTGVSNAWSGLHKYITFPEQLVNAGDIVYIRALANMGGFIEVFDQVQIPHPEPGFDLVGLDLAELLPADLDELTPWDLLSTGFPISNL